MFFVALASLLVFAVMLHFHEKPEYAAVWWSSVIASALLWPIYVIEFVLAWRAGSGRTGNRFWCCVLPPLRIAARDQKRAASGFRQLGWQCLTRAATAEKASNVPMIALRSGPCGGRAEPSSRITSAIRRHRADAVANSLIWLRSCGFW
jgi:hypothetical protein